MIVSAFVMMADVGNHVEGKEAAGNGVMYVPHAPIRINSNVEFDVAHGVSAGNGTQANPWVLENYNINGTGYGYCIYIGNTTDYFVVRNCYLHEASGYNGDWCWDSGLYLHSVQHGTIANNTVSSNDKGIILDSSASGNTIANNTVNSNSFSGIHLDLASGNIIVNNIVSLNIWYGIVLDHFSNSNVVINNNVSLTVNYGIDLNTATGNIIANNTVSSNSNIGIYITASSSNTIYHNNIINNTIQAYDAGANQWDNGYPSGGNYWSDYAGVDNFKGASQNIPEFDGIGDTPYAFTSNQDDYPLMMPWPFSSNVRNVDTGEYFETIQTAIDDTDTLNGHTIEVSAGTYYEHVTVNKRLTINGAGRESTIIDGSGVGNVVTITSNWVKMTGFNLTHSAGYCSNTAGITLNGVANCIINNTIVANNDLGIYLIASSNNNISGNTATSNIRIGILLANYFSQNNIIANNIATLNPWAGIYVDAGGNNNYFAGNTLSNNGAGFTFLSGSGNTITNNSAYSNINGVTGYPSNSNIFINNNFSSNSQHGIQLLLSSNNNIIANNILISNSQYGLHLTSSNSNSIYHNYIDGNTNQAYDDGINFWDNGYPSGGNYWGDYAGVDNYKGPSQNIPGFDGIGDTPYIFTSNQDHYPLMKPWPFSCRVKNVNTGEYFETIQAAIDDTDTLNGHTIMVSAGTYYEHVTVNKQLTIIGTGRDSTIIDGSGVGDVVYVTIDWVNITGFTIRNSGNQDWPNYDSAIQLSNVDNANIQNNSLRSTRFGICLVSSNYNTILDNNASSNYYGIYLEYSNLNIIENNIASMNLFYGIYLYSSGTNCFNDNTISSNNAIGILLGSSNSNTLYHNNILNNVVQAQDNGINQWDNGYPSGGNYWGDYAGVDNFNGVNQTIPGFDGIGDTPYAFTSNQDDYPLMMPWPFACRVRNVNTGEYFETIQAAIDDTDTVNGHTIEVSAGTYYEHVTVNKQLNLIGAGRDVMTIDGGGTGIVVTITANWVNMTGFKVTGSGGSPSTDAGVQMNTVQNCRLENNTISGSCVNLHLLFSNSNILMNNDFSLNAFRGVLFDGSSSNFVYNNTCTATYFALDLSSASNSNIIRGNNFSSNSYGGMNIAYSTDNIIENNCFNSNACAGIYMYIGSDNNIIRNNSLSFNQYGLIIYRSTGNMFNNNTCSNGWFGVAVDHSDGNTFSNNNCSLNWYYSGFVLSLSNDNTILNNTCNSNNEFGIYISGGNNNIIVGNTVNSNSICGIKLESSNNNIIYHNNILSNTIQAYDDGVNQWDNGYPSGGNYWGDYTGIDIRSGPAQDQLSADSIGDTPKIFPGGQDNYPLMYPWGTPRHTNEYPCIGSTINGPSPTIWVHVTDETAVDIASIKFYVNGFNLFSSKNPIIGGYNVSYVHTGAFSNGQVVTCRIIAGDFDDNVLDWTWTFTVDLAAPSIISVEPLNGADNVPLDSTIKVTFSEMMNHASAEAAFIMSPSVSGSFGWNGNVMTFTPGSSLDLNTVYTVTIGSGAIDCAGNHLAANYTWSFSTGDTTPPEHSCEHPSINGYTSDLTPVISVHVTDGNSVNASTIRLYVNGFSIAYVLNPIPSGYNVSYWHESGFLEGTLVICRIVATDNCGNTLDYSWSFLVTSTPPIAVVLSPPTQVSWSSMQLTWTCSNDSDFSRYEIYKSLTPGVLGSLYSNITNINSNMTIVTGLTPGITYYFTVRVVDTYGLHADSNQVNGTTVPTVIGAPSDFNIVVAGAGDNDLVLSWDAVAGADHYNIYFTNARSVWDFSAPDATTTGMNWTHYSVNDPMHGNYSIESFYIVRAVGADGYEEGNINIIGKHTYSFEAGWNSFALVLDPLVPFTADSLCDAIQYCDGVSWFNILLQEWIFHAKTMPGGVYDTMIELGFGYQISMTQAAKWILVGR